MGFRASDLLQPRIPDGHIQLLHQTAATNHHGCPRDPKLPAARRILPARILPQNAVPEVAVTLQQGLILLGTIPEVQNCYGEKSSR